MPNKKFKLEYFFILFLLNSTSAFAADQGIGNAPESQDDDFYFDPDMLVGAGRVENLNLLRSSSNLVAGEYDVDVYLNGNFIAHRKIMFKASDTRKTLSPCLDKQYFINIGVLPTALQESEASCDVARQIAGASSNFDESLLRLSLYVPQAKMQRQARGAVPQESLEPGNSMLFVNYDANYYKSRYSGANSDSGYVGLNSGFNLGLWQLRHQSNFATYSSHGDRTNDFKALNTYVRRPLIALNSEMVLGDIYTSGEQFGSLGLRGFQLYSDDRMLPESQRGYAPSIRGIANTNANIIVKQLGNIVYQTSVPPGEFIIDDLSPTNYQGDLDVEIQEANGHVRTFSVPFSAVPESVRDGQFKYNLSVGKIRNIEGSDSYVGDLIGRYGLANWLTLSSGLRAAEGYRAALLGNVFSNTTGAYGINMVYSNADIPQRGTQTGWRFSMNYSKTFQPTNTNIALAAYRYSTSNYYDLGDVLGLRGLDSSDKHWVSTTFRQRNQFTGTVSQSLNGYGNIYASGSVSNYRGGRSNDTQYRMGYNFTWNRVNYSLAFSRQKTGYSYYGSQNDTNARYAYGGSTERQFMFSLSMPLGNRTTISSGYTYQSGNTRGSQFQSGINGSLGEDNTLSYDLTAAYDHLRDGENSASISSSAQKQFGNITMGANLSKGHNYTQGGISARGAAVFHSGGMTLGPYLSDSFALVEASGASGAMLKNGMGARINNSGYAIMPSLTPYRYNEVVIDPQGVKNNNIELSSQSGRIAPYAGAMVKVKVKTTEGYPLLLSVENGSELLSLGENVFDKNNEVVGMVSQGGMIYARVKQMSGTLFTRSEGQRCTLPYDIVDKTSTQTIYRASTVCQGDL